MTVAKQTWKDDTPVAQRPAEQHVQIDFSSAEYAVAWDYSRAAYDYTRMLAGIPDVDAATGRVLTAKTIVIIVVPRTHGRTTIGEDTWTFADGSGPAWVVEDGAVVTGTWDKPSRTDRLRILDANRHEVAFNRGPQWVEIIPPEVTPTFTPKGADRAACGADGVSQADPRSDFSLRNRSSESMIVRYASSRSSQPRTVTDFPSRCL